MKYVVVDTSFLVACAENRIDIERELTRELPFNFKLGILDRTMDELNDLIARGRNTKLGQAARLAQSILIAKQFTVWPTPGRQHTDVLLAENADDDHIIATIDAGLKQRLKSRGQPYIIIRQKKYLRLVGA